MTEKQIEIAARKLCELRGIDPEERVWHGVDVEPGYTGHIPDVAYDSPRWARVAVEIRRQLLINEAIEFAKDK